MSGSLKWWVNRKSRLGMSPAACRPPEVNGREWWTTPPVMAPQPEHLEYVVQYQLEISRMPPSDRRTALQSHVSAWLKAARRLLHEQVESTRGDLHTTDGLIVAARGLVLKMKGEIWRCGGKAPDDLAEVLQALDARAHEIRRRRAVESSKRTSQPRSAP